MFNARVYQSELARHRVEGESHLAAEANEATRIAAARSHLLLGQVPDALVDYEAAATAAQVEESTIDATPLQCECAYALALKGLYAPALSILDTVHHARPSEPCSYAVAAWVFFFAGFQDASRDFWEISGKDALWDHALWREQKTIGVLSVADLDEEFRSELKFLEASGVVVLTTFPGPEDFRTELKSKDILLSINARSLSRGGDIEPALQDVPLGSSVKVKVFRQGQTLELDVKVTSLQASPSPVSSHTPPVPSDELLDDVEWADVLLEEGKPFQSAFAYRSLHQRYPSWDVPHLGYSQAAEDLGAYRVSIASMERAVQLAENDSETKVELAERLSALKNVAPQSLAAWRMEQDAFGPADIQAAPPKGAYFGFAGGQWNLGGDSASNLSLSSRLGVLFSWGTDLSASIGYTDLTGSTWGLLAFQRLYITGQDDASINFGIRGSLNSKTTNTYGPVFGLSHFFGKKKNKSFDLFVDWTLKTETTPSILSISLGWTNYFAQ